MPVLDLVVKPCILCKVLDLSCKVLPGYVHDVGDGVFVLGRVVVLGMWVVCEVEVRVESYPYLVQGCKQVTNWSRLCLVGLV